MLNRVNLAGVNSAELLAEKFLALYFEGKPMVYPLDPFAILKKLDIPFTFRNFVNYEGVYIAAESDDDRPVVGINKNRPITRQRFTAAHEICHHLKDRGEKRFCPIYTKNAIEKFADQFAAAMLMPLSELRKQVALYEVNGYIQFDDVIKVADYFAVSFETCLFRIAYKLNEIDGPTDSKNLKKRIKQFKPNQKRSLLNLPNYDIGFFKAVLDNAISFFIYNSSRAVWYRFKNNFIYNENRLEGLDIDLPTVSEIITDLRLNKQASEFCKDDYNTVVEVAGHAAVYDYIIENSDRNLSAFKLLDLNRMLFQYAPYPEAGGSLREMDTLVLGAKFETVHYKDIPQALMELDQKIKEIVVTMDEMSMCDFIDEVVTIHHRITVIHPFRDGNGRTARVFLNWMFILKGIPPVYLKADRKDEYVDALQIADLRGDFTKLREVFYKAVVASYIELSDFSGL
jgi:Zn-dependent peptidase ImmA (M78 family)/fido (protein-threonine AMPylation protein)